MSAGRTLADELAWGTRSLEEVGIETARLDAELLLAHLYKLDRAALLLRSDEPITGDGRTGYLALVARRASHEPVAYITGKQGFRYIDLSVDARVLIPRPETELLVEVGLKLPEGARVADVGTGSGAVALALKQERPDLLITGLELSAGALDLARHNAMRLRLDVELVECDLLDDGDYDAVLANLPYVRDGEILAPNVANFEPARALFGGPDGLDVVAALMAQLTGARPSVTLVALEIGFDQGAQTAELVRGAGFEHVEIRPDLAGHDRVVVGRRP
jgi:release factor glutamine methyltransferase